jgi:hypothetical protein
MRRRFLLAGACLPLLLADCASHNPESAVRRGERVAGTIVRVFEEVDRAIVDLGQKEGVSSGTRLEIIRLSGTDEQRCGFAVIQQVSTTASVVSLEDSFSGSIRHYRVRVGDKVRLAADCEGKDGR